MITLKKVNLYKKYGGDVDGLQRFGSSQEQNILSSEDWGFFTEIRQDLHLIHNGLVSEEYKQKALDRLYTETDSQEVLGEVFRLAGTHFADSLDHEIIGLKILEIYETEAEIGEEILWGQPHYFSIVLKLENERIYELGIHGIKPWHFSEALHISEGTPWATDHNPEYRNQRIVMTIQQDPEEYFEGSFALVLENNVALEHVCCFGDQLHIGTIEELLKEEE